MNIQTLPQEIQESYNKSPQYVRDFIDSPRLSTLITRLNDTRLLHIDALSGIIEEVIMSLVGITSIKDLPVNLKKEFNLSDTAHATILNILNEEVFVPINKYMKNNVQGQPTPQPEPKKISADISALIHVPTPPPSIPVPVSISTTIDSTVPQSTLPAGMANKALEIPPPHEITVRTMKNDVVSVKAGEKPSRFVLPPTKKEDAPVISNPVSKYLKPLGVTPPAFADSAAKPAFSSRFASTPSKTNTDPASLPRPATLPPQTFLPIKPKEPVLKIDPLKTMNNMGSSFIPKSPVVPQAPVKTAPILQVVPTTVPIQAAQPTSPSPKPTLTIPTPPLPATPATVVKSDAKKIDPYREIPE